MLNNSNFGLSFIIPIYNVEKFLHKCLDSIILNDWGNVLYEIIIVDDASPDNSIHIANEYALKYNFIKVISQENKGLGGARNTGIKNAKGEYIFFMDSDDFLLVGEMKKVLEQTKKNSVDIIEFGARRVNSDYKTIDEIFKKNTSLIVDGITYAEKYNWENSVCNKLYRRLFLIDNKIEFFEKTFVEDAPFNSEAYFKAAAVQSMAIVPVAFYQNSKSITRQKRTGATLKKFIEDSIKVTQRINDIASAVPLKGNTSFYERKVAIFTSGTLLMILRSSFTLKEKKSYIEDLKALSLYPINNYTGIFIRDFFIFFTNRKSFLWIFLRFGK